MKKGHIKREWYEKCLTWHEENYASWWRELIGDFYADDSDHFRLIGSSSYLVKIGKMRFALDPVWLIPGTFDTLKEELKKDLAGLDFIIFTHEHGDHFNPEQISVLKELPVKWLVPNYFDKWFLSSGVKKDNCIFLAPDMTLEIAGGRIETFDGHHHYLDGSKGPEELMYVVKSGGKKIFFPADLRDFDPAFIPGKDDFDHVFLHMYLSRTSGADYPFEEYFTHIAEYAAALPTKHIFLGHLYGFQYGSENRIWNYMHAGMLEDALFCLRPDITLTVPKVGRKYML